MPLRIGFLLPANFAFSPQNGIRQEALLKMRGLQALGHTVVCVDAWQPETARDLDVLHFFYGGLALSGVEVARQCGVKKLVFSTTIDSNQNQLAYRLASRLGRLSSRFFTIQGEFLKQCRTADLVIVRSAHEQLRVCLGLGVPQQKVQVVPLGIELGEMPPLDLQRTGIFHLSTYGQQRKNVERLIDAVGPTGLPLTIAGYCDPQAAALLATRARPYPNIRFLGAISADEKLALFRSSEIFALPSLNEGTGLSALEAAVQGCKVVITKNGGPPDYFSEFGWLVDPYSVVDIRAKIMAAHRHLASPTDTAMMRERFGFMRAAKLLEDNYGQLLGRKPVQGGV